MIAAWAALVAVVLACPDGAHSHGYLQVPPARSWLVSGQKNNGFSTYGFYGPMNLNRAGKPLKGATCGGEKVGDTRFEVGGKWASRKIVASYKAGATIKTKVHIAVNHWGYFELRLCPLDGTTDAAEKASFSENCFAKHPLKAVLPGGKLNTKYWLYRNGDAYDVIGNWKLPNVKCLRCVLQWRYVTAHMCHPPGTDEAQMKKLQPGGSRPCPKNFQDINQLPSEKFWNCADIRLT